MSYKKKGFDNSFYNLANQIARVLEDNKDEEHKGMKDWEIQKKQLEDLMMYEDKFKQSIYKSIQTREIYKKFIITTVQNNILSARPFFREQAKVFSAEITPAIKEGDFEELKKFRINYKFMEFIRENWKGRFPNNGQKWYDKAIESRRLLIENSLPLAVNIAKRFFKSTPESYMELTDFINTCTIGLISGVDKYSSNEYSKVFRSVCIGRMKGGMVEDYSQTLIHFYPSDKKILYKINILKHRENITDINELCRRLNEVLKEDKKEGKNVSVDKVTIPEIMRLMHGASTFSADKAADNEEEENDVNIYTYAYDEGPTQEEMVEKADTLSRVLNACEDLDILEMKILKLKGVSI
jgi:DNA-directed RNA polymerase specialized sigma subunit